MPSGSAPFPGGVHFHRTNARCCPETARRAVPWSERHGLGLTQSPSGARKSRVSKYLPMIVALFLPLVAYVASERIPTQSELAQLEFHNSAFRGDRAHRLQLPTRLAKPLTRRVLFVVLDNWRRQVALNDSSTPGLPRWHDSGVEELS